MKDNQELDFENDENMEDNDQPLDNVPDEEREVTIDRNQMSIFELNRRYKRNDLDLQPEYQRKDVWNPIKKSKLIESVLRNIPIPSIYLSEVEDNKWEVVDGQQRLKSFFDFLDNQYKLGKLPVLDRLNGKFFRDLDIKLQRKIEDYQLHVFIIKKESHEDIKFDIFERINEGASRLNAQELRTCIYRGEGIKLIQRLAKRQEFHKLIDNKGLQKNRREHEEAVLRFLSFYLKGYESYTGNLKVFLNDTLRNYKKYKEKLNNIEIIFIDTMKTIYKVFGDKAFIKKNSSRKKVNISLFDIITVSFAKYDRAIILSKKDLVLKRLEELMSDQNFIASISSSTVTIDSVFTRFEMWFSAVEELIEEDNE